ncbi:MULTISPECIES: dihydrofolate reductase family protein [Streptomyces]|uniref:Dihydrofolate reductase family protein n=1 Tax=Streptomyces lichenis TaxID=2306967 RepID=A0ABT0IBM4_9ACTN|nr:dihydrofolate reductase family protein [Streptomyces lichenis]MCK8678705.1 dihydrofolate reductase family protein [Streptomyces lichenis]
MATLTLNAFLTLDGVMQAPGGPEEDPSDGFTGGGWQAPFVDEDLIRFVTGYLGRADGILLGRRTYEIFAGYWPKVTDEEDRIAGILNSRPKYVVSSTLTSADWEHTTLLGGDPVAAVTRLKEEAEGEVQVHGSTRLAGTLVAHGLLDELNLLVHPVFLGQGRRLFPDGGAPAAYALTGQRTTGAGVVVTTYRPEGPARFGLVGE